MARKDVFNPPPQEAKPQLSPYDHLTDALRGELAGSPKVQAFSDYAALKDAELTKQWIDEGPDDRWPMSHRNLALESYTQIAIIKETIRKNTFGPNAGPYAEAFDAARNLLNAYVQQADTMLSHETHRRRSLKVQSHGIEAFLKDLENINRQKSS